MRDIGRRIQRYRLSRYATARRVSLPKWAWIALGAWLLWAGVVSDHSFYQLWRIERAGVRERSTLRKAQGELSRYDRLAHDPRAQQQEAETHLREDEGWSRPDEILFRIDERGTPAPPTVPAPVAPQTPAPAAATK
jgi:hypothetical protein